MRPALAIALVLAAAPAAAGQTPPNELEARALFEAGEAAVGERRFDDARRLFERSLELHPTAAAAFNAAVAAEEAGDLVGAVIHLDRLLDGAHGGLPGDRAAQVRAQRTRLLERLGTLVVRAEGEGVRVTLDGAETRVVGEAILYATPGTHELVIAARTERRRTVELAAGERRVIDLMVEARLDDATPSPSPEAPARASSEGPDVGLIVAITGAALLVVGGAVAIGVGVHEGQRLPDGFLGSAATLLRF